MKPTLRKFLECLGVAALSAALVLMMSGTSLFRFIETKSVDFRFTFRDSGAKHEVDTPIVIVTIDGETLARFPDPADLNSAMLDGINILSEAKASAIGFDVLHLSAADPSRCDYEEGAFLESITNSGLMVVPYYMMKNDIGMPVYVSQLMAEVMGLEASEIAEFPQKAKFKLLDAAEKMLPVRFGFANLNADTDGVIREVSLAQNFGDSVLPGFALSIYLQSTGLQNSGIQLNADYLRIGNNIIPLNSSRMMINYAAPPGHFPHVPLTELLDRSDDTDFVNSNFSGRIVLMGAYDLRIPDFHPTPYYASSLGGTHNMFGVEIVANILNTIVNNRFIKRESRNIKIISVATAALIAVFLLVRLPLWLGVPILAVLMAAWAAAAQHLFSTGNFLLDIVSVEAALPLSFLLGHLHNTFILGRDKRFIQRVLGSYLDPRIVKDLSRNSDLSLLRGRRKEITVMFSDIRGFTTLSEKLSPEQVVEVLNVHLSAMSEVIIRSDGMVDKYVGDAIMAVWNAPNDVQDHRLVACRAALEMRDAMKSVNAALIAKGVHLETELKIGIGINTGQAIIGNIGSVLKSDYTAIGDTVNVASRLEGLNKQFGTVVIISDSVAHELRDSLTLNDLGAVPVKGRAEPVPIFELQAISDSTK